MCWCLSLLLFSECLPHDSMKDYISRWREAVAPKSVVRSELDPIFKDKVVTRRNLTNSVSVIFQCYVNVFHVPIGPCGFGFL